MTNDQVTQVLGSNGATKASVATRGSKGAVAVEVLDGDGNQVTAFGGSGGGDATAANQATEIDKLTDILSQLTNLLAKITKCDTDAVTLSGALASGDNNIGNVDIASAIPAGTNLIGKVSASDETSTIYNGATAVTPAFTKIDAATIGDNTIVSAGAAKIRVLALFLVSTGTVTVRFESGASGTALTGQMDLVANTGFVLPYNPLGWFETASATLLNLELSAGVSVDGGLTYIDI